MSELKYLLLFSFAFVRRSFLGVYRKMFLSIAEPRLSLAKGKMAKLRKFRYRNAGLKNKTKAFEKYFGTIF